MDTLFVQVNNQGSYSNWITILQILAAFLGGGLISLTIESIRIKRRGQRIQMAIIAELKQNLEAMENQVIQRYPWMGHMTWSNFYYSNSAESLSFFSQEKAEKIVAFYNNIELLKMRTEERKQEESRLIGEQKFDGYLNIRQDIGELMDQIRKDLIAIGKDVIS